MKVTLNGGSFAEKNLLVFIEFLKRKLLAEEVY